MTMYTLTVKSYGGFILINMSFQLLYLQHTVYKGGIFVPSFMITFSFTFKHAIHCVKYKMYSLIMFV